MSEDLQTKTVSAAAAYQVGLEREYHNPWFTPRPIRRHDLDPADPAYVEPPDDEESAD
jgi:hypothetical protein